MTEVPVEVAVALITNRSDEILWTFNSKWGAFCLPMTKRKRGHEGNEPPMLSSLRAAAEAIGVPVRLASENKVSFDDRELSGRQLAYKAYHYYVFHVEPHPDFADQLQIQKQHIWLTAPTALSMEHHPLSESSRNILRQCGGDFLAAGMAEPPPNPNYGVDLSKQDLADIAEWTERLETSIREQERQGGNGS